MNFTAFERTRYLVCMGSKTGGTKVFRLPQSPHGSVATALFKHAAAHDCISQHSAVICLILWTITTARMLSTTVTRLQLVSV